MRILISVWHPAHFHFFKNIINELENRGHEVFVISRDKEQTLELLDEAGINFKVVGKHEKGNIFMKFLNMVNIIIEMKSIFNDIKPDILCGVNDTYSPILGKLVGKKSINFTDDDIWMINSLIYLTFSNVLVTPYTFRINVRNNHIKYKGIHEIAYLHPKYYNMQTENKKLTKPRIIFRLVGWFAAHDVGHKGITTMALSSFIRKFENEAEILISSERVLPLELEKYKINISPSEFHSYLESASLVLTDSQTTSTEASLLGTPVIRTNSFVGKNDLSNFHLLGDKYGLIYNIDSQEKAFKLASIILKNHKDYKIKHQLRRNVFIKNSIDVSNFAVNTIISAHSK